MNRSECSETVRNLIERETELARDLRRALDAERTALTGSDPAALDAATALKQSCVTRLDAAEAERLHLCTALGVQPDAEGMTTLSSHDSGGSPTAQWQTLLDELAACRRANERNGVLVRLQRRRVATALGILHGETGGQKLYGENGEVSESAGHHVHTAT